MIQVPRGAESYRGEILEALSQTGIRQLSPGGKARAFADIVGDKIGQMEAQQFLNLANTLLPYANGDALDLLGEIHGVSRIRATDAVVASEEVNFKFFVRRGTFGNINNGLDILIPSNVRISTASASGPIYLTDATVLQAAEQEATFSARSLFGGALGNAPAGVFTRHNFTGYADALNGTLLVTNQFGVVGGREAETDEALRFRISLKIQSRASANEAALRLAVLQVPGIQDLVFHRASGTFTVYVYGITPSLPVSLLQTVQATLDELSAYPLVGTAVAPDLVGISLATTVRFAPGVGAGERELVLANAVSAASDYINNLRIGEALIINEIADRIRNSDNRILDIGEVNRQIPEIFLWRERADGSRYSRILVGNLQPEIGERIIVEAIPSAIRLTSV